MGTKLPNSIGGGLLGPAKASRVRKGGGGNTMRAAKRTCTTRFDDVEYLIQRPGCNWAVRLQMPGGKATEVLLRTADYREAEVRAQDYIKEHKAKLLAARLRIAERWQHRLEPGRKHPAPDGG